MAAPRRSNVSHILSHLRLGNAPHSRSFDFRSLGRSAVKLIFFHLEDHNSRLALAATSKYLRLFARLAYVSLQFKIGRRDDAATLRTIDSLIKLKEDALSRKLEYQNAVCSLTLTDAPGTMPDPESEFYVGYMNALDRAFSHIVAYSPRLCSLIIDATSTGRTIPFPHTLNQVLGRDSLHSLTLFFVEIPANHTMWGRARTNSPLARVALRYPAPSPAWCGALLAGRTRLRRLDLWDDAAVCDVGTGVLDALVGPAQTWCALETLTLTCRGDALPHYTMLLWGSAAVGAWPNLTAVSLTTMQGTSLLSFVAALSATRMRRLRVVVNLQTHYVWGFGPALVHAMLRMLPFLEELVLDHSNTAALAPFPGTFEEWGAALGVAGTLQRLVLPALFFVAPDPAFAIHAFMGDLQAWASRLVLGHMRASALQEIVFLHDRAHLPVGRREAVGFERRMALDRVGWWQQVLRVHARPYDMFWEPQWTER